ncbi:hypothetical protein TNCV_2651921 [Trichonephila clavipes]|nr:hypothetical protein TNCV_2651921 [Trichonephila clavipes]
MLLEVSPKVKKHGKGSMRQKVCEPLIEIEEDWWEYLERPAEERERLRDPFIYRDRDLHLNPCLRVIPDNFKEKPKKHKDCEQDFSCNFLKRKRAEYEKMYQWTTE